MMHRWPKENPATGDRRDPAHALTNTKEIEMTPVSMQNLGWMRVHFGVGRSLARRPSLMSRSV